MEPLRKKPNLFQQQHKKKHHKDRQGIKNNKCRLRGDRDENYQ